MDYNYTIYFLESYPNYENYQNVVFRVVYNICAVSGSYTQATTTDQEVEYTPGSTFVPFDQLTKETVVSWIESSMGPEKLAELKNSLKKGIERKMNPETVLLSPLFEN